MAFAESDQWHLRNAKALGDEVMSIMKSPAGPSMIQEGTTLLSAMGTEASKVFSSL